MRAKRPKLTLDVVLREVRYDALTGSFTRVSDGKQLGFWEPLAKRISISICGHDYGACRVAWMILNGEWPTGRLTFKDGNRRNLAAANLTTERRRRLRDMPEDEAQQRLHRLFDYDPEQGVFIARIPRRGVEIGEVCSGCAVNGYYLLTVDGEQILLHRLIWLYVYGKWPSKKIDHRDGNGLNNRIQNLRDVTQGINVQNQRRARVDNRSTGLLGSYRRKDTGRFTSRIGIDGKSLSLGCFDTAEEAHSAYVAAKRRLHEGCTL
jgi:hypothetical protein